MVTGICFCVYQIHWCRWLEPLATILLFCRVSEKPFTRPSYDLAHRWPWLFCSLCILLWKRYLSFFLYVLNRISFRWMLEIVLTILSNQNSSRTYGWVGLVNYLVTLQRWKCSENRNISSIINKSVFSRWKYFAGSTCWESPFFHMLCLYIYSLDISTLFFFGPMWHVILLFIQLMVRFKISRFSTLQGTSWNQNLLDEIFNMLNWE